MTIEDYLDLITSAWRQKPKFTAMVSSVTGALVQIQNLFASMTPIFDLDLAIGDQLDIIGEWVGVTRNVQTPISGVYFSWDSADYTLGWDFGTWQPFNQPTNLVVLPDDAYRLLIRAKISANSWDGTSTGAYAIWDFLFPNTLVLIIDHQDMSYSLAFIGGNLDTLTVTLLTGGYIPLKPEGVQIAGYLITNTTPIFAWDSDTTLFQGWDTGNWIPIIF